MAETSLVTVYVASGLPEAHIIKGKLETEAIPVLLSYESAGLVYGLTVDGLGEVQVMVPPALAEKAKEILRSPANRAKPSDPARDKESESQSAGQESD